MLEKVTLEIKRSEESPPCIYIGEVCLKSSVKAILRLISSVTSVFLKKGARLRLCFTSEASLSKECDFVAFVGVFAVSQSFTDLARTGASCT